MKTFRRVTFPLIFPGVLSAMLFAFTLSYDEFPRTLFAAGADLTLPLAIYGTFSVEIHPNIFAFGVLTTDDVDQALARAGGSEGNKGAEAARAAIEMATLLPQITAGIGRSV